MGKEVLRGSGSLQKQTAELNADRWTKRGRAIFPGSIESLTPQCVWSSRRCGCFDERTRLFGLSGTGRQRRLSVAVGCHQPALPASLPGRSHDCLLHLRDEERFPLPASRRYRATDNIGDRHFTDSFAFSRASHIFGAIFRRADACHGRKVPQSETFSTGCS